MKTTTKITTLFLSVLLALGVGVGLGGQTAHAAELCDDINDAVGGILDCGSNGDVTSFSDFQGGLTAPTGEGLDPTLTKATTAREFIINTVNFALSFLGIIAVVVVIYGGFLYVTAAGNDDQTGKGKKAILYAGVGILIIIASYAFVNTILTFGGGSGTDTNGGGRGGSEDVRGSALENSNLAQQTLYNLGSAELSASLNDLVVGYKNLAEVGGIVTRVANVSPPTSRDENRAYIGQVTNLITEIKNSTSSLSETHLAAQRMLDEYLFQFRNISDEDLHSEKYEISGETSELFKEVRSKMIEFGIQEAANNDFISIIDSLIGPESQGALLLRPANQDNVQGRLPLVWKLLGPVADQTSATTAVERGLISPSDLQRAFSGIDPNTTVGQLFAEVLGQINGLRSIISDPQSARNAQDLVEVIRSLDKLNLVVKNIKFVYVRINSSVREGNAPLIVELNGLDSRDPTGRTIPDDKYIWDPDGDGKDGTPAGGDGSAAVQCASVVGPTISCTYNRPGTYRARLKIASQDPDHIAGGEATYAITVKPSNARIVLKATIGSITEDLRAYERDESGVWQLRVDKNEFQATVGEARQQGLRYNATESRGADNSELANFSWSYGETGQPESGEKLSEVTHKYPQEGTFPLTLEVTDRGNRKDRKITNVVISSIAARVGTEQTIGEPEELIEFDGTLSRSDNGRITSYEWEIRNEAAENIISKTSEVELVGSSNASILRAKFKKPGSYTVHLKVSDASGSNATTVPISIKSRKPRANIAVRTCPKNCPDVAQPSVVEFDARSSFDPDTSDKLTYNWQFFNELGDELQPPNSITILNDTPLSGQKSNLVRVSFRDVGTYKVVLTVNDSHADESIRQEDRVEQEFTVESIVEAKWDANFVPASQLVDGVAPLTFKGVVNNADRLEIDYGDGAFEQAFITTDRTFSFVHEYTETGSYLVTLNASSESGKGQTEIRKRVYIARGDQPVAVLQVSIDGNEVILADEDENGGVPALEVTRNQRITFDARNSIRSTGKDAGRLKYSWNFGDQGTSTTNRVDHSYSELTAQGEVTLVRLTVTEPGAEKISEATFPIRVVSRKPQLTAISLEKQTAGSTTPVEVKVSAEGAVDPDGRVTSYQFWYYDPAHPGRKLGVIDTRSKDAILTVETSGIEGEEREFAFCAKLTDNENQSVDCDELLPEGQRPTISVTNGENQAPTAEFRVDRTNIRIGEDITFTSSSSDTDGSVKEYIWDVEGNGFQDNNPTTLSSITHTYSEQSPRSGFRVKLKVIDDKGASGYSEELPIFVTTNATPPNVNFTYQVTQGTPRRVKFFDATTADRDNNARIVSWKWDFDTSSEIGCDTNAPRSELCNGDKADDVDSTDQNPVFDFPHSERYQVKLTVEDSAGNIASTVNFVDLIPGSTGATGGVRRPAADTLKAELKAELKAQLSSGTSQRIEQRPGCTPTTIDNCNQKVLHVPADACGASVTYFWGDSRGEITDYALDSNIYFDADGDGQRHNDIENAPNAQCRLPGTGAAGTNCSTATYQRFDRTAHPRGPGNFRALLTVTDRNDQTAQDTIDVVFDKTNNPQTELTAAQCAPKNLLGGNIFNDIGLGKTIIFSVIGGILVILGGMGIASFARRGQTRV
ncbi:hypothetical protein CO046_01100 [Candidatus Peregrinibacteria bacterium CG_4_9_14_0_2_um_filter_53_11]|nr:MAG: hypothetical protein CO046_01100 [Candidatus Peregrinibacteria bacterium CG_4_9_14_0_2_um_filter_53_11]